MGTRRDFLKGVLAGRGGHGRRRGDSRRGA
jgi:hypothetical protein